MNIPESKGQDEIKTKIAIQDDFVSLPPSYLTIIVISVLCMYLFVVNLKSYVKIDEISTMKIVLILVILCFVLISFFTSGRRRETEQTFLGHQKCLAENLPQ